MPYFEAPDNVRLFYEDWGAGRPVVFVSAWALSSKMWQYQMLDVVAAGFRAVAYDRRGHGRSDRPGAGYCYDSLADDLAALLDTLDLHDAVLVSHSMGEGEAVRYLTRHGSDRVAKLVLVAPLGPFPMRTPDNPGGVDPTLLRGARELWRQDFPSWLEASQDAYVGAGLPGCDVSAGLVAWTRHDMLDTSLLAVLECGRSGAETDRRPDMAGVHVPTLIIHGDHDASAPAAISGEICAQLIEGSTFHLYKNAPHGLYLTHWEQLSAELLDFARS